MLFWWQLFNAWSGSNPIDGINLTIFNLVYTSLPIMVVGIADQDLQAGTLLREKFYYTQGRKSMLYTHWKFWLTVLDALYQSATVFFLAYGVCFPYFNNCINLCIYLHVELTNTADCKFYSYMHLNFGSSLLYAHIIYVHIKLKGTPVIQLHLYAL